ncbi:MAG: tyrosine-type recombinase/integrase, partial [Actinomycetia bacterium]|nr:tyrosine-type recombinase/integrase [Actinomycetes bacterium]
PGPGAAGRPQTAPSWATGALVFGTDPDGRSFWPSNFSRRVWRPALKRAGLAEQGYRFHDLRHTAVSRLIAEGADIKLVRTIAGHSSPTTTLQRYAHLLDSRVYEAASKFDQGTNRAPKHGTDSLTDNIRP